MALVVEDGTGLSNANAYVAVADVDSYASAINYTAWASLNTAQKEAAIIAATTYIDANFMFTGARVKATQALSWPRTGVTDRYEQISIPSNIVPNAVKRVCMDLAIKSSDGTVLLEDQAHGGAVKSEQVGPLKVEYKDSAPAATLYAVSGLLKGLLRPTNSTYGLNVVGAGNNADQYFTEGQFENNGSGLSTGG